MAKIFRTQELSINEGKILLTAGDDGKLEIKNSSNEVVTSTELINDGISSLTFKDLDLDSDISSLELLVDSDVSSLNWAIDNKDTDLDSDISSLEFKNVDVDSDISSLVDARAQNVSSLTFKDLDLDSDISSLELLVDSDVSSLNWAIDNKDTDLDSDISSLEFKNVDVDSDISSLVDARAQNVSSLTFKDLDLDSDISSLGYHVSRNDVVVVEHQIIENPGDAAVSTVTIDLGRKFMNAANTAAEAPKVVGVLMSGTATDAIIGCMLQSVSYNETSERHEAVFVFSDDIASTSYKMQVLASV